MGGVVKMQPMDAGQIERDPEIALLVGVFVARWSLAEFSLMLALMVALKSPDQEVATSILAATTSAEAKIQVVLKALDAAKLPEDVGGPLKKAVKGLNKLCPARNELMHHLWGFRHDGLIATVNFRETDVEKKQTIRSITSLKDLCNAAVSAAFKISKASGASWIDERVVQQLHLKG